jgi:lysine 6-dehydrogenase
MKKITLLGAGMVGRAIARDLSAVHKVTVVDIAEKNLHKLADNPNITTIKKDLSLKKNITDYIAKADLVINAVPGFMGFKTLKTIIQSGKNVVDIAFFPEDPFLLDDLAKTKNITAVTDCGVAPGMSNMILGYYHKKMKINNFICLVGGLPVKRTWPYEYKAPFSPSDVLEEYTRPARYKENNCITTRPALSDPEFVDFAEIGTLESFNSDGLRTLLHTIDIPNMKEKTLRYPGHIQIMQILRETGFFSTDTITINNTKIRPLDVTSNLLFKSWKLPASEAEFTVMKITVAGTEKGRQVTHVYDLFDKYDPETGISSMARTTGYTCTAVADLILNHKFSRRGICPPEYVGAQQNCLQQVLSYLKERNVIYQYKLIKGKSI